MKEIDVAAAIIEKENQILIARRLKGEQAGLWEFPGGKVEPGESSKEAVEREIQEEFDSIIEAKQYLCTVEYDYPSFHLKMDCFICSLKSASMQLHDHSAIRWIDPFEVITDWVPADRAVILNYQNHLKTLGENH